MVAYGKRWTVSGSRSLCVMMIWLARSDADHSSMCADPSQYDGSATSGFDGCSGSDCDGSYWKCDAIADYLAMSMTSDWSACSTANMDDDDPNAASEAYYTSVLARADARTRKPEPDPYPRPLPSPPACARVYTSGNFWGALAVVRATRSAARTSLLARRPRPPCRASSRPVRSSPSPPCFECRKASEGRARITTNDE